MVVTVAVAFISVVSGVLWRFPVFRVCVAVGGLVRGQRLCLLFDACAITCCRSFTVLGVWVDLISFRSVFSRPPVPFVFITLLLLLLLLLLLIITVIIISTELLALCDGCLGWGWVWLAGLMAGCG